MRLSFCLPSLEESGSELCFISHPNHDRRVGCNMLGHTYMSGNWKGWEVWRFTRIDDSGVFIITSWTHDRKVLCSNEEGRVYTTENKHGSWEKWKISLHPTSHGVMIESVEHGRLLAFGGHRLNTINKEEDDTAWHLEPAHGHHFFISAVCHDKRLSSTNEHPFTQPNREEWEKWIIEPTNSEVGHFNIRSQEHGKYLGSLEHGELIVSESEQSWVFVASPHGGFFIKSIEHGRNLSCDDNGNIYTSKESGGWETWQIEPIMPGTISGKQIWSMVGVGVGAVATAVAMPFAVIGVVGAMGFGSGGIAAGSFAAGMMSAEAIASGVGGVAAGGTVATLQSIGCVGLGAAGASAAASAGAVVGGGVVGGVITASGGLEDKKEEIKLEEPEKYLPLCSWRMWK